VNVRRPTNPAGRLAAIGLLLLGAGVTLASIFADQLNVIGLGAGFGWKQLLGAIAGLVILLLGVAWLLPTAPTTEGDEVLE